MTKKFIFLNLFIVVMIGLGSISNAEQSKKKLKNSLDMQFVLIQPGKFMMGSPEDEAGRYTVTLAFDFVKRPNILLAK